MLMHPFWLPGKPRGISFIILLTFRKYCFVNFQEKKRRLFYSVTFHKGIYSRFFTTEFHI